MIGGLQTRFIITEPVRKRQKKKKHKKRQTYVKRVKLWPELTVTVFLLEQRLWLVKSWGIGTCENTFSVSFTDINGLRQWSSRSTDPPVLKLSLPHWLLTADSRSYGPSAPDPGEEKQHVWKSVKMLDTALYDVHRICDLKSEDDNQDVLKKWH